MRKGLKNFILFFVVYWITLLGYGTFMGASSHYEVLLWLGLFGASVFFVRSAKDEGFNKWLMVYAGLVLLLFTLIPHLIALSVPENAILYAVGIDMIATRCHVIYLALAFALKK